MIRTGRRRTTNCNPFSWRNSSESPGRVENERRRSKQTGNFPLGNWPDIFCKCYIGPMAGLLTNLIGLQADRSHLSALSSTQAVPRHVLRSLLARHNSHCSLDDQRHGLRRERLAPNHLVMSIDRPKEWTAVDAGQGQPDLQYLDRATATACVRYEYSPSAPPLGPSWIDEATTPRRYRIGSCLH
jgi:hypothetical protein